MQLDQQSIDPLDKELLNDIQWTFPLSGRPYLEIATKNRISEDDAMRRISNLKRCGLIRQINAIFDTRKLGYKSALVAFAVKKDSLDSVALEVNKHPGVSHNYERDHEFNMWFTLAVPPDGDLKKDLEQMASFDGVIKFRLLPTLKLYKIGVKLDMVNSDPAKLSPDDNVKTIDQKKFYITARDKEFIRELQKDLEVTARPFDKSANNLGITVDELFDKAVEYESIGVMRRFAAILRHRDAGFTANGMIVWKVPDGNIDEVGYKLASFPQVSHCYRRPVYPDWPFNLFSMIHARTIEAAKQIAIELSNFTGVKEYRILFSSREFKKERVKYFVD
jgi:siroheme decarboxylase